MPLKDQVMRITAKDETEQATQSAEANLDRLAGKFGLVGAAAEQAVQIAIDALNGLVDQLDQIDERITNFEARIGSSGGDRDIFNELTRLGFGDEALDASAAVSNRSGQALGLTTQPQRTSTAVALSQAGRLGVDINEFASDLRGAGVSGATEIVGLLDTLVASGQAENVNPGELAQVVGEMLPTLTRLNIPIASVIELIAFLLANGVSESEITSSLKYWHERNADAGGDQLIADLERAANDPSLAYELFGGDGVAISSTAAQTGAGGFGGVLDTSDLTTEGIDSVRTTRADRAEGYFTALADEGNLADQGTALAGGLLGSVPGGGLLQQGYAAYARGARGFGSRLAGWLNPFDGPPPADTGTSLGAASVPPQVNVVVDVNKNTTQQTIAESVDDYEPTVEFYSDTNRQNNLR